MRRWLKSGSRVAAAWAMTYKSCKSGSEVVQKWFNCGGSADGCPTLIQTRLTHVATLFQNWFNKFKCGSNMLHE
eukprot:3785597-Pyramimonas_sp.AAC.1